MCTVVSATKTLSETTSILQTKSEYEIKKKRQRQQQQQTEEKHQRNIVTIYKNLALVFVDFLRIFYQHVQFTSVKI